MTKSGLVRIAVVLLGIVVLLVGRGCYFYSGYYSPPATAAPDYGDIIVPPAPAAEFPEEVVPAKEMAVLIDLARYNDFDLEELNALMLQLISRGLTITLLDMEDELETELSSDVGALVIVSPTHEFSKEEKEALHDFLDNGGRLLLIADPTRRDSINKLSLEFGLIFEPGYLYNMTEYETNYRNIFVTDFEDSEITRDLKQVVFYTAGSISSADGGIAFVDDNTHSSQIESRTRLSPMAMANDSKVLAIYDLTFMTEPYNGTLDNNQLIANIADWLADAVVELDDTDEEDDLETETDNNVYNEIGNQDEREVNRGEP